MKTLHTQALREQAQSLQAGESVLLSGIVYTARDAAHQRLCALLQNGEILPFSLADACIYYAGPSPAVPGAVIGSCGPTTSGRMDLYTPLLLENGLAAMIGKGPRNEAVCDAIEEHNAVYFCAMGGLGALAARCVRSCDEIAFPELGCESVKCLLLTDLPLIVGVDSRGGNIFLRQ